MSRTRMGRWLLAGVEIITVAVCLVVWTGTSAAMVMVPRQPMREAAVPVIDDASGAPLQAVIGISDSQMKLYAPAVITVKSLADLEGAEAQATAAGKNLWISVGGWDASRARSPEVVARLESGAYEKLADLPGWEPMFSYQIWRRR